MRIPLKCILVVAVVVAVVNVVMKITASSVLFYPLYPGVLAHFFIEGAHGTSPHPILGVTAEVAVNVGTAPQLEYFPAWSILPSRQAHVPDVALASENDAVATNSRRLSIIRVISPNLWFAIS